MTNEVEFDLLAAAFRQLVEFRRRHATGDAMDRYNEMEAEIYEAAIARRDLRGLRATFSDLCGVVETVFWGPEYLREFEARHGVSLWDVRGAKSPKRRLERILSRESIDTPAELRIAQDQVDFLADDAERELIPGIAGIRSDSHACTPKCDRRDSPQLGNASEDADRTSRSR